MNEWGATAETYVRQASFVPALAGAVVERLALRPGERVLDLGCGDGTLTVQLAATGADVVAVDADASMVAAAAARGLADVRQVDGQRLLDGVLDDVAPFDAVFSNAALHWMPDSASVVAGVHHLLRPGGRFVAEFGGFGNVAAIRSVARAVLAEDGRDAPNWFFPSADAYADLLTSQGFVDIETVLVPRPTLVPAGLDAWLRTFLAGPLAGLSSERADMAIAHMTTLLAPAMRDEAGNWWVDYVRLRVHATHT